MSITGSSVSLIYTVSDICYILHASIWKKNIQEPVKVGVAVVDLATGLSSVGAITAALYQREKTGKGTKIECSLLETQVR